MIKSHPIYSRPLQYGLEICVSNYPYSFAALLLCLCRESILCSNGKPAVASPASKKWGVRTMFLCWWAVKVTIYIYMGTPYMWKKLFNGFALIPKRVWTEVGGGGVRTPPSPPRGDATASRKACLKEVIYNRIHLVASTNHIAQNIVIYFLAIIYSRFHLKRIMFVFTAVL